jgi:uncharacterized protein YlxW (UPF0749 family)
MIEILGLIATIIGTILSVGSACFWVVQQNSQKEIKRYAAEREFGHIKNSLLQLTNNLSNEFQDLERRLDEIKSDVQEIKFECRIDKK